MSRESYSDVEESEESSEGSELPLEKLLEEDSGSGASLESEESPLDELSDESSDGSELPVEKPEELELDVHQSKELDEESESSGSECPLEIDDRISSSPPEESLDA